jgi:hypothetical protein
MVGKQKIASFLNRRFRAKLNKGLAHTSGLLSGHEKITIVPVGFF